MTWWANDYRMWAIKSSQPLMSSFRGAASRLCKSKIPLITMSHLNSNNRVHTWHHIQHQMGFYKNNEVFKGITCSLLEEECVKKLYYFNTWNPLWPKTQSKPSRIPWKHMVVSSSLTKDTTWRNECAEDIRTQWKIYPILNQDSSHIDVIVMNVLNNSQCVMVEHCRTVFRGSERWFVNNCSRSDILL